MKQTRKYLGNSEQNYPQGQLGLIADPVIEAIARLEFEDGMRMGVHLAGCWGP